MHVIERTDRFTLIGSDARRGKLTLFAAEGPREPRRARARGPAGLEPRPGERGAACRAARGATASSSTSAKGSGSGSSRRPRRSSTTSTTSRSSPPTRSATAAAYERLGFDAAPVSRPARRASTVGGAFVEFHPGRARRPRAAAAATTSPSSSTRPRSTVADADDLGVEVADFVDAPNTLAVFVCGPERRARSSTSSTSRASR